MAVQTIGDINISIYNILGQKVMTVVNQVQAEGFYMAQFNASSLSSGVYFYTLTSGNYLQTKKMLLLK